MAVRATDRDEPTGGGVVGKALGGHHRDGSIGLATGTDCDAIHLVGDAIDRDLLHPAIACCGDEGNVASSCYHLRTSSAEIVSDFTVSIMAANNCPAPTRENPVVIDQDLHSAGSEYARQGRAWEHMGKVGRAGRHHDARRAIGDWGAITSCADRAIVEPPPSKRALMKMDASVGGGGNEAVAQHPGSNSFRGAEERDQAMAIAQLATKFRLFIDKDHGGAGAGGSSCGDKTSWSPTDNQEIGGDHRLPP